MVITRDPHVAEQPEIGAVPAPTTQVVVLEDRELRADVKLEHVVPEVQVPADALRIRAEMVRSLDAQVQQACVHGEGAVHLVPRERPDGPTRLVQLHVPDEIPPGLLLSTHLAQVVGSAQMQADVPGVLGFDGTGGQQREGRYQGCVFHAQGHGHSTSGLADGQT